MAAPPAARPAQPPASGHPHHDPRGQHHQPGASRAVIADRLGRRPPADRRPGADHRTALRRRPDAPRPRRASPRPGHQRHPRRAGRRTVAAPAARHRAAAHPRPRRCRQRRRAAGTGRDRRRSTAGLVGLRGLRRGDRAGHGRAALVEGRLQAHRRSRAAPPRRRLGAASPADAWSPDEGGSQRHARGGCAAGRQAARRARGQ